MKLKGHLINLFITNSLVYGSIEPFVIKMKLLIFLSLTVFCCAAKTSKQLKVVTEELNELKLGLQQLGEKIQSLEDKLDTKPEGVWRLGMNINPSDGHIFGYTVGKDEI